MEPRIESRQATLVVGMCRSAATDGETTADLWRRFMPRRGEIRTRVGTNYLSMRVYRRSENEPLTPSTPFDEWAAVAVLSHDDVPAGMEPFLIPDGTYAVFTHRGPAAAFPRTAQYIFGTWLPGSDYELDDRPHFALMGADYRPDDPDAEEEIWIPVSPPGAARVE